MPKDYPIKENIYLILLRYFNGEVVYLTDEKVKDLKKTKFEGEQIPEVDASVIKVFTKILKLKKKKPKEYANIRWVYPTWSQEEKEKRLKEAFPEEEEEEEEEEVEEKVYSYE